ncbi:hypothetical protein JOD45_001459 [Scopulibacillus daqui]|uniref:Spore germination protein n=1 Tax=Scopulibacillus daqui TaxID=1469162 RepID=A0ABS2PZ73_9BACL|nr:spore germination protein [Scopulibacillus daqui]MBM7645248.1 hypothetical protein [Scopulibacillus daqui]
MPSIAGPIKINSVGSGAVFHVGDSLNISPKSTSKTYAGSGALNTGDFLQTNNMINSTNTLDSDLADGNNAADN